MPTADTPARWGEALVRERARISRLLHDELGQALSAVGLQLDLLRLDYDRVHGFPERIRQVQTLLEDAVGRVRELSNELNPAFIEQTGLAAALEHLVHRSSKLFAGTMRWSSQGEVRLSPHQAHVMYLIAEEALENAMRHSQAGLIEVSLCGRGGGAELQVRDDGRGMASRPKSGLTPGLGLSLMRGLAREAGLRLTLASRPEKGTIVKVTAKPLRCAATVRRRRSRQGRWRTA